MKRLALFGILLLSLNAVTAQTQENELRNLEKQDTVKRVKSDTSLIVINNATIHENIVNDMGDTVKVKSDTAVIRIGKKKIVFVDSGNKTTIEIPSDYEKKQEIVYEFKEKKRFKGHWSGFEMGINGFLDKNQSMNLKNDLAPFDLKQARSWNFNLNFMQYSIGFGTDKAGLVTGMGLEFNNYHFSNPISLKIDNGITVIDSSYIDAGYRVEKTKLSTTNLTLPLLLEFQIPTGEKRHRIYMAAGVIGGLRIGSHTKVVFDDGDKRKDKNRSDFNIATFRYGVTARLGYRAIRLYANYYPVQLFEKGKGPELYPFSVGLVLIPFRD
ncbi:MAG: outer membrane beta-barrel protein [Bacteroidales bacterium]|nr:MAG: outer membrane beta-barrel protein [Bacteroidales bacterium]